MQQQYEGLIEENTQLKKAIISSKAVISRKINEYETLQAINEELKSNLDKMRLENQDLLQKYRIALHDKKQTEQQFDNATKNWKLLIEQKQREIEEIQSRLTPAFDQDMMRIKLLNELDLPHRQQLEQKQLEIEKLNEIIYQLKRKIDLEISRVETIQIDKDKEMKLLSEKHKLDLADLQHQISDLTRQVEDNKDRDTIRRLRKDLEEYKLKFSATDTENEELRNERDKIREEKNDIMIKFARQLDSERNDKRQFKSDFDKLQVRTRFLEDEFRKEKQRREQVATDFEILKTEKDQLLTDLRKKDDTIHYLQRKITDMEEEQVEQEQKVQDKLTRLYQDEHDKYLQERNKAVTLQKDVDNLKKRFSDLQDDYKVLRDRYQKENIENKDSIRVQNEEIEKLKKTVSQQTKEIGDLERSNKNKEEQLHDIENENETIKRRNRELQHRIQLIEVNPIPTPVQTQPIMNQSQIPTVTQVPQFVQQEQFETTKPIKQSTPVQSENDPQNQQQMQAQKQSLQQITEENRSLISKNKKLNKKLKIANEKILELSMKNTILEKSLQRKHSQPPAQDIDRSNFGLHAHSQSPFKQDSFQQQGNETVQQRQQQQQMIHTDTRLDRYDKQDKQDRQERQTRQDRFAQQSQEKYRPRGQSGVDARGAQGHPTEIRDDELLSKVMMLTDASGQNIYW
ncbi:unnamed protein product (macronuclear) [Paramecium tetraurelia]|uniref:Uncharacterized protein n=1 Tax=Paramecium tetraurelia TaxID=5888 RepID=A0E554_PARTE|nr:uncharacterized protein GSPATT00023598001 [Paramecium tetraurelia]CAK90421.1 unnamed protein product [Paramecium tetraurelia]|eukprot:XP_001457818.1 hypothetical protein (macronuclear) [Paramecium tetraurelia strain d4-2]